MLEIIEQGGFIMYPLLIMSCLSLAIFMERAYLLYIFNRKFSKHFDQLIALVKDGKINEARGLAQTFPFLIKHSVMLILDLNKDHLSFKSDLEASMQLGRLEIKRRVWVLGTVASSAPFIGLFGTVVGIIKSFKSIAVSGKGGFSVVAQGLSEALIATAAGILVAVFALIFYNVFNGVFSAVTVRYKTKVIQLVHLVDHLKREG